MGGVQLHLAGGTIGGSQDTVVAVAVGGAQLHRAGVVGAVPVAVGALGLQIAHANTEGSLLALFIADRLCLESHSGAVAVAPNLGIQLPALQHRLSLHGGMLVGQLSDLGLQLGIFRLQQLHLLG